MGIECYTA